MPHESEDTSTPTPGRSFAFILVTQRKTCQRNVSKPSHNRRSNREILIEQVTDMAGYTYWNGCVNREQIKKATFLFIAFAFFMPAVAGGQTYVVRRLNDGGIKGYADIHVSRAAMSGEKIRIWFATLTNPDCSSAGTMTAQIITPPHHGHVDISTEKVYPNFVAPNPRVICDTRKVDGVQAFYTADAGYHGHDKIVLQNATSEGRVRRVIIDVDVR